MTYDEFKSSSRFGLEELMSGDRIAICLVGAGLTWVSLLLAVEECG